MYTTDAFSLPTDVGVGDLAGNSVGLIRRAVGEGKEECESGKIIGLYYVAQASPFFIRAHRIASWGRESVIIRSNFGGEAWAAHRWRKVANIPTRP